MKLIDLNNMIADDLSLSKANLLDCALNSPSLWSKYYKILIVEGRELNKIEQQYKVLYKEKTDYYCGKAPDEVYKEKPFNHKVLKSNVDVYIDSDDEIIELKNKLFDQRQKYKLIEDTMSYLTKNRGFDIKNSIDMIKFQSGA